MKDNLLELPMVLLSSFLQIYGSPLGSSRACIATQGLPENTGTRETAVSQRSLSAVTDYRGDDWLFLDIETVRIIT